MPETETLSEGNYPVDADLFYVLATVLLLAILLALLAGLSTLNSIKNGLAGGTGGVARDSSSGGTSSLGAVAESSAYDLPAASATQTGSAYAASPETSSYSQPEPASTSYSQPEEVSTGFVSMAEVEPQLAQASSGAVTLRGDEPEEQPFEREGRWWFKRGGELLVYEEGTGQWVPADAGASATGGVAASTSTSAFPTTGSDIGVSQVDTGEGWKCSSCGAINGSTATSCRMCFAPR